MVLLLTVPVRTHAQSADHDFELSQQLDIFTNIYTLLDMHYVDTLQVKKSIGGAITHMLSAIDPYTVYYPEDQRDELIQFASGRYAGLGVGIRVQQATRRCMITHLEHGGAAEKAGLKPGDIILRIDNREIGTAPSDNPQDMNRYLTGISLMLRGESGSTVDVDVLRNGQSRPRSYTVRRQLIEKKSVIYAAMVSDSIGYVCLSRYSEQTATELRQSIATLKQRGAQKLILDLRDNPGGLIKPAIETVGLFVSKDTEVLRTRGKVRSKDEVYSTTNDPIDELLPLVVLVDGGTASAAEITAGALQDYDRAVILGRRTFGKGLVQSTFELPYGGLLKLTSAKFYIPSGRCIQALDYSRRTASGDPMPLPDSLTHAFQTSAGRTVYDGGGIKPDVEVLEDTLPEVVQRLLESDVFYDFVADYSRRHRTVEPPLRFEITENDFAAFKAAVITSGFEFGSGTREAIERARALARSEGYDQDIDAGLATLSERLSADPDRLMERHRRQLKKLLERQIVLTYYGEAGLSEYALRGDRDVTAAVALLRDDRAYRKIITTAPDR